MMYHDVDCKHLHQEIAEVATRVNNKKGKRVSNVLCTRVRCFRENHTPGIQKLTNESARFK